MGRGLETLIPGHFPRKEIIEIDIIDVFPNENQPRKVFDKDKLEELAVSIKENGIIQPVIVKKIDNKYMLIAGERRWRAASIAGLRKISAIVQNDVSVEKSIEIGLIENIQRQDLNPLEMAQAFKYLIDNFGYTQELISKMIGKSRSSIANTLRLLESPEIIQRALSDGSISEGHARALLSIDKSIDLDETIKKIMKDALTVREVEKLVTSSKKTDTIKKEVAIFYEPFIKEIEKEFEDFFNTKVTIKNNDGKGMIEIRYSNKEQLDFIVNRVRREE